MVFSAFAFLGHAQRNGRTLIPGDHVVDLDDVEVVTINVRFESGWRIQLDTGITRFRAANGTAQAFLTLPSILRQTVGLPSAVHVEVVSACEATRKRQPMIRPLDGVARFPVTLRRSKGQVLFEIPNAWFRGLFGLRWGQVSAVVEQRGSRLATFDASLRLSISEKSTEVHPDGQRHATVTIPSVQARELAVDVEALAELRSAFADRPAFASFVQPDHVDWLAVVPDDAVVTVDGEYIKITTPYAEPLTLRR